MSGVLGTLFSEGEGARRPDLRASCEIASWPVSRVLSGGLPLRDGHSSGTGIAPSLEQPTRAAAWITPGCRSCPRRPCRPYSVLLPVGFAVPLTLPQARCALTAPFHPCLCGLPRAGGLLSVALSLGSPPAAVSRHRRSLEPGLSSTGRVWPQSLIARQRPSGQLAGGIRGVRGRRSRGSLETPSGVLYRLRLIDSAMGIPKGNRSS